MRGGYFSRKNFLFDLDGTLIDSEAAHTRAFIDTLTTNWPTLAKTFNYSRFAGRPTREVFFDLGLRDEPELSELVRHKQQYYRIALEQGQVKMFAGVNSLLEQLSQSRARLFLVTGASRISAERVLEQTMLGNFFESITTAEDTRLGKPSPACFLHTLSKHNLEKRNCLVVEDAKSGIMAAHAAGLDAVLIHTKLSLPSVINVQDCQTFAALLSS